MLCRRDLPIKEYGNDGLVAVAVPPAAKKSFLEYCPVKLTKIL